MAASSKISSYLKEERKFIMWTRGCAPVNRGQEFGEAAELALGWCWQQPLALMPSNWLLSLWLLYLSFPKSASSLPWQNTAATQHSRYRSVVCTELSGSPWTPTQIPETIWLFTVLGDMSWCRVESGGTDSGAKLSGPDPTSAPASSPTLGRLLDLSELHCSHLYSWDRIRSSLQDCEN